MIRRSLLLVLFAALWLHLAEGRILSEPQKGSANDKEKFEDARPPAAERTFTSKAIDDLITKVQADIKDEKLKVMFGNCLPSTLDTTVKWYDHSEGKVPKSFVITGDISAMWFRDSCYQVVSYFTALNQTEDPKLQKLIEGVIQLQADFLLAYPYANAFFPPKESGLVLPPNQWAKDDVVYPEYDNTTVFEAKYELDSLASFFFLSTKYFEHFKDTKFVTSNPQWVEAAKIALATMKEQQQGTMDDAVRKQPPFTFKRPSTVGSETTLNNGEGNPVRRCGLIRSFFRPSDDATLFQYLIPSNAMAVVGLEGVAKTLEKTGKADLKTLAQEMKTLATEVRGAINKWAIVKHRKTQKRIYAYEVDCYGSYAIMDDANVPSLLSLPVLGYLDRNDEIYRNTREVLLSTEYNPYFFKGESKGGDGSKPVPFEGIGSPHTGFFRVWPMSIAMRALTSDDDDEIIDCLEMLRDSTAGTGMMHEGFLVSNPDEFSRTWFAWANTVFGELILDIHQRKPYILKREEPPKARKAWNGVQEI